VADPSPSTSHGPRKARLLGTDTPAGRERFDRQARERAGGYRGPLDQDASRPDAGPPAPAAPAPPAPAPAAPAPAAPAAPPAAPAWRGSGIRPGSALGGLIVGLFAWGFAENWIRGGRSQAWQWVKAKFQNEAIATVSAAAPAAAGSQGTAA